MENRKRVRSNTSNACTRCRRQKIRCSGTEPCAQCVKRNTRCEFNERERKVLVTKGYLDALQQRSLVAGNAVPQQPFDDRPPSSSLGQADDFPPLAAGDGLVQSMADDEGPSMQPFLPMVDDQDARDAIHPQQSPATRGLDSNQAIVNPLVSASPTYSFNRAGWSFYRGSASSWSFSHQILRMAHDRISTDPMPVDDLLFEGRTYDLGWRGEKLPPERPALPTPDFATHLINTVKFYCGQLFHLFDERTFMQSLAAFRADPQLADPSQGVWFPHYLLVLAIGQALNSQTINGRRPPGAALFAWAMSLLPDSGFCAYTEPMEAIEALCCAALYLHCLDFRIPAYTYIGQAMRLALCEGLHTDLPATPREHVDIQRCRHIWWTVYLLDCHMSSAMGVPLTIPCQNVDARLPEATEQGQEEELRALGLHTKLGKVIVSTLQSVYGVDGRMDYCFVPSVKSILASLAEINDERLAFWPDRNESDTHTSISRLSASLQLFHHYTVLLATRPLLFFFWQQRLAHSSPTRITSRGGIRSLIRLCVNSAQQALSVLTVLQEQFLLDHFLPFDLDLTTTSTLILLVAQTIDPTLLAPSPKSPPQTNTLTTRSHALLTELSSRGNLLARTRLTEIRRLETYLAQISAPGAPTPDFSTMLPAGHEGLGAGAPQNWASLTLWGDAPSVDSVAGSSLEGDWDWESALDSQRLISVADSLAFDANLGS